MALEPELVQEHSMALEQEHSMDLEHIELRVVQHTSLSCVRTSLASSRKDHSKQALERTLALELDNKLVQVQEQEHSMDPEHMDLHHGTYQTNLLLRLR